jgi:type III secretion protein J
VRDRGGNEARRVAAAKLGPLLCVCGLAVAGCTTAVASDLPETEANRAVVALETHGVSAEKERDPETEGRFRVLVGRDEAAAAAGVLSQEALPSRENPGVLQSLGNASMVPSRLAEHARLLSGISGELEQSLQAVDGVVSARVHLAAPERSPLDEEAPTKPSASVLIRHRGAAPPLAASDVQRLVAGAVPGLAPADVSVVSTPAPSSARPADKELRRVGPITVTRASLSPLRFVAAGAVLLNLALLGAVLLLWSKVRRTEDALGQARAVGDAAAR